MGTVSQRDIRSATLGAERPIRGQLLSDCLDEIPISRKCYALTIKAVANSMIPYLDSVWYADLVCDILALNSDIREVIYVRELDSRGILHIHGVLASRKLVRASDLNFQFPGVHIYITRLSRPQTTSHSGYVNESAHWRDPRRWYYYLLKDIDVDSFTIALAFSQRRTLLGDRVNALQERF